MSELLADRSPAGEAIEAGAAAPAGGGERRRLPSRAARRARAARLALAAALLAAAAAGVVASRGWRDAAEVDAAAIAGERVGAAGARAEVEQRERDALDAQADAEALEAAAAAAREEQRARLREIGMDEFTIDAFLEQVGRNTQLVEWRRDETTEQVDRQAQEVPGLERCLVAARRAINTAFTQSIDPDIVVPSPSEVCRALMVPSS